MPRVLLVQIGGDVPMYPWNQDLGYNHEACLAYFATH